MDANAAYLEIIDELKKHISGQKNALELMFITIVANGHALLEGVPGVAKTTMTKALADTINADFNRVQGLPDITASDILGYTYQDEKGEARFKKGPIFTNILLIDELNRTPTKTMGSLLEAFEERQVTVEGGTIPLPIPFTAFATQNPLKIEGTDPIPKVLADRFAVKIDVDYPSMSEEEAMLNLKEAESNEQFQAKKIIGIEDIISMQQAAKSIILPDGIKKYITKLVDGTRTDLHVIMGASPRADLAFMHCGKARALVEGRKEVTADDIRFLAKPVLSHRIVVRSTGGIGVHGIIDGLIASIPA